MTSLSLLYRDLDRLPYLLALRGAARARGLELDLVRHRQIGNEDWGELLKRGEVDGIAENYWALVRYRAAGEPFVTVASASHWWREALLARPGIASLDDLRGRRFAARATGPQIWFPGVFLKRAGLADEVEIVQVSERETGRFGNWKRVASGDCDACFVTRLYIDEALAAGLREIPHPAFAFEGGHVIPTVTEALIRRNPDAVQLLVSAMFDACAHLSADPERMLPFTELALEGLREYTALETPDEIARLSRRLGAEVAALPIPLLEGTINSLEIASARFPELADFNPFIMWDLSFARAALREPRLSL